MHCRMFSNSLGLPTLHASRDKMSPDIAKLPCWAESPWLEKHCSLGSKVHSLTSCEQTVPVPGQEVRKRPVCPISVHLQVINQANKLIHKMFYFPT